MKYDDVYRLDDIIVTAERWPENTFSYFDEGLHYGGYGGQTPYGGYDQDPKLFDPYSDHIYPEKHKQIAQGLFENAISNTAGYNKIVASVMSSELSPKQFDSLFKSGAARSSIVDGAFAFAHIYQGIESGQNASATITYETLVYGIPAIISSPVGVIPGIGVPGAMIVNAAISAGMEYFGINDEIKTLVNEFIPPTDGESPLRSISPVLHMNNIASALGNDTNVGDSTKDNYRMYLLGREIVKHPEKFSDHMDEIKNIEHKLIADIYQKEGIIPFNTDEVLNGHGTSDGFKILPQPYYHLTLNEMHDAVKYRIQHTLEDGTTFFNDDQYRVVAGLMPSSKEEPELVHGKFVGNMKLHDLDMANAESLIIRGKEGGEFENDVWWISNPINYTVQFGNIRGHDTDVSALIFKTIHTTIDNDSQLKPLADGDYSMLPSELKEEEMPDTVEGWQEWVMAAYDNSVEYGVIMA